MTEFRKRDIRTNHFFVPLGGCNVRVFTRHDVRDEKTGEYVFDPDTGEVEQKEVEHAVFGLSEGVHKATQYAESAPRNAIFQPVGENAAQVRVTGNPRKQAEAMKPLPIVGRHKTGANEAWTPKLSDQEKAEAMAQALHRKRKRVERARALVKEEKEAIREEVRLFKQEQEKQAREDAREKVEEDARQAALEAELAAEEPPVETPEEEVATE